LKLDTGLDATFWPPLAVSNARVDPGRTVARATRLRRAPAFRAPAGMHTFARFRRVPPAGGVTAAVDPRDDGARPGQH
jgi:hypothetical protein